MEGSDAGGAGDGAHDPAVDVGAGSHRATTQPPKPPPVIRAPKTPGVAQSCSTAASMTGVRRGEVVAQAAVAVDHHLAGGPVVATGERGGEVADALVLGDDVAGPGPHDRIVDGRRGVERGDAERSDHGLGRCALRDPLAVLGALERAMGDEADDDRRRRRAPVTA